MKLLVVMIVSLVAVNQAQAGGIHLWNCLGNTTRASVKAYSGVAGWSVMLELYRRDTRKQLGMYPVRTLSSDEREAEYVGKTENGKIELDIFKAIASPGERGYRATLKVTLKSGKTSTQQMSCMRTK